MKFVSVGSCSLIILITAVFTESLNSTIAKTINSTVAEKASYPKKVSSIKKNSSKTYLKKVPDITEKFKDLPADDLTFIKELDKQFKLHGGKIKIKVENKNNTETKNGKRTIDGELGYGFPHNGYEYNPPKFTFYPYSQKNILNNAPKYFLPEDKKSQVSIQPSYSYELNPQSFITHNEPQIDVPKPNQKQQSENFVQQQQHYEEPVIVLRIPGPAKYAKHLQMLLQQYLEIRAAQYLHILEEAEQRKYHQQNQLQQIHYYSDINGVSDEQEQYIDQHQSQVQIPEQHDYQQQAQYDQQIAMTPQTIQYPEIDDVYHSYRHRYSLQSDQIQKPQLNHQQNDTPQQNEEKQHRSKFQQQEQNEPQFYHSHQQQYTQPEDEPINSYHNVYFIPMMPHTQVDYEVSNTQTENQQSSYVQEQSNKNVHSSSLPISENNPRSSHTKVLFTNNNEHAYQDYQMYQSPSLKPNKRYTHTSIPDNRQDFDQQQHQHSQDSQETSFNYQHQYSTIKSNSLKIVPITQSPYNYHARSVKTRARGRTANKKRESKTKDIDQGLQKIREYVRDTFGAETGSAIEYKTTQVIDG